MWRLLGNSIIRLPFDEDNQADVYFMSAREYYYFICLLSRA